MTQDMSMECRADQEWSGDNHEILLRARDSLTIRSYRRGQPWQLGAAAYWEMIASSWDVQRDAFRLGDTLAEEAAACILGGFGMPAALGIAAFERLRDLGMLVPGAGHSVERWERALNAPLTLNGRIRRYRFPNQRARRLEAMMNLLTAPAPLDDLELRDWLVQSPGVGLKTASWIVRNYRESNRVAIVDIHVVRAGVRAGVFDPAWRADRDYYLIEQAFLAWAGNARIPASVLDASIWAHLAGLGPAACDVLGVARLSDTPSPVWPSPSHPVAPRGKVCL